MKNLFNGYDITNIVIYNDGEVRTAIGNAKATSDSLQIEIEIENFLKYLKAKYN